MDIPKDISAQLHLLSASTRVGLLQHFSPVDPFIVEILEALGSAILPFDLRVVQKTLRTRMQMMVETKDSEGVISTGSILVVFASINDTKLAGTCHIIVGEYLLGKAPGELVLAKAKHHAQEALDLLGGNSLRALLVKFRSCGIKNTIEAANALERICESNDVSADQLLQSAQHADKLGILPQAILALKRSIESGKKDLSLQMHLVSLRLTFVGVSPTLLSCDKELCLDTFRKMIVDKNEFIVQLEAMIAELNAALLNRKELPCNKKVLSWLCAITWNLGRFAVPALLEKNSTYSTQLYSICCGWFEVYGKITDTDPHEALGHSQYQIALYTTLASAIDATLESVPCSLIVSDTIGLASHDSELKLTQTQAMLVQCVRESMEKIQKLNSERKPKDDPRSTTMQVGNLILQAIDNSPVESLGDLSKLSVNSMIHLGIFCSACKRMSLAFHVFRDALQKELAMESETKVGALLVLLVKHSASPSDAVQWLEQAVQLSRSMKLEGKYLTSDCRRYLSLWMWNYGVSWLHSNSSTEGQQILQDALELLSWSPMNHSDNMEAKTMSESLQRWKESGQVDSM